MNPNNTQSQSNFAYPNVGQQTPSQDQNANGSNPLPQQQAAPVQQLAPTQQAVIAEQPLQNQQLPNTPAPLPSTNQPPIQNSTQNPVEPPSPVDGNQKKEENPAKSGDEASPLQALAKKLSNLKDEFVEEVDQEKVEATTPPPAQQGKPVGVSNPSLDQNLSQPVVNTDVNNVVEVPSSQMAPTNSPSVSIPTPPVAPVMTLNNENVNPPVSTTPEPVLNNDAPNPTTPNTETNNSSVPMPQIPIQQPMVTPNTGLPSSTEETGKSLDTLIKEDKEVKSEVVETPNQGPFMYSMIQLLDLVVERDASDLHITVGYPVMIRVDGDLQNVGEQVVTEEVASELILSVLSEQKKELLEVNREVDLAYAHGEHARFRINAYYQKESMAAAFRLIPSKIRTIQDLKLPQIYNQLAKLKQGLVLVTGPTGSGKSTTLAAILQEINMTRPDHIITIEDPIEYVFPKSMAMVDQREMHEDTHSWEIALKSALRQDPDVMLVGEMRDFETIAAAITLAETGHLVFATLHTNSASQTVDRIIDVFPEHQQPQVRSQLSHVIESVIAQRLIPLSGGGRAAVSEIMIANPAVKNLIREGKTHQLDNVIMTSADVGMISLEHSLVKLVRENLITMEMAQEYAVHPEEVVRLLKS